MAEQAEPIEVADRWYALRIIAWILAVIAWILAIATACYGAVLGVGTIMVANLAESPRHLFLGLAQLAAGLLGAILTWAIVMAVAQLIRLVIAIEENTRVLVALAARSEVDVRQ